MKALNTPVCWCFVVGWNEEGDYRQIKFGSAKVKLAAGVMSEGCVINAKLLFHRKDGKTQRKKMIDVCLRLSVSAVHRVRCDLRVRIAGSCLV